jgi:TP901 family phage tail tape measure protein
MATAATISARLTLDATDFDRGLGMAEQRAKGFGQKLKGIGSDLSNIGRTMTMGFTVPIIGGAALATKAYIDLDTQMQNIQSIATDLDDNELAQLRETFVGMSTDINVTRDSASGLAEAFYFIQSSGFQGAAGMQVLEVSTKAASAGLTDTKTSANAILSVLNAYGMTAADAAHVSDVLFKTVDVGVLTFNDLASQLGDVVNTASMVNVPIEDVGAAIGLMTRKGVSASESVTALNQLLLQFVSPSDKMKKAAKEMGVELSVDTLRSLGLAGALEEIVTKGGGTDALLTLFGDNVRALKGALTLAGDGLGEFNDMQGEFADVSGRTSEAFATQNKSVAAQMDNFKNTVTALGLSLAGIFIPVLMQVMKFIQPLIARLEAASPATKMWIVIILALVAVIGPLLIILGSLFTVIGGIITVITAIGLPIILIVALIGLLIAGLIALYLAWINNWGGIRDKTMAIWAQIQLYIQAGLDYIRNIIAVGMQWISDLFAGKLGYWSVIFANSFNALVLIVQTFISNVRLYIQAFKAFLDGDFRLMGALIRIIWENSWRALTTLVSLFGQNIVAAVRQLGVNLKTAFSYIWTTVQNDFKQINWNSIGANIANGIYNGLKAAGQKIVTLARQYAQNIADAFSGFFGIHSESTLMTYYGEMAGMGWRTGLQNTLSISPATALGALTPTMAPANPPSPDSAATTPSSNAGFAIDYERLGRVFAAEISKVIR